METEIEKKIKEFLR